MPFCPMCRSEYREGYTRCSDCDVDLVAALPVAAPDESAGTPVNLVELAAFATDAEAEMFREILEKEGIASVLHGDFYPIVGGGGPSVSLLVDESDLTKAGKLLEDCFPDEVEAAPEEQTEDPSAEPENP